MESRTYRGLDGGISLAISPAGASVVFFAAAVIVATLAC